MKRILIISHEFPPNGGGAGIVAEDIANNLLNYNIDITLATSYEKNRKKYDFNLVQVKTVSKIRPYLYWKEIKKLNLYQFDKIILNDQGASMVGALFFDDFLQNNSLVYLHGNEPEKIFLYPSFLYKAINYKEKYIELLNNCQNIISVSKYMKDKFLKYSRLKKLKPKIIVIYNGIDRKKFFASYINLYKRYKINQKNMLLLSVSRIIKEKGYDEKYMIFKQIIAEGYNYHWIIVGNGKYLRKLKRQVLKDNLLDRVTFINKINRCKLKELYSSVDLFWLLSRLEESLGLVYLEASACGIPVIGKNKAGVKEAILQNKSGFLVDSYDECLNILRNKTFIDIDKKEIKNHIIKFYIDKTISELVNLL